MTNVTNITITDLQASATSEVLVTKTDTSTPPVESILVITIPKGDLSPYIVGGRILQRIGDRLASVTAQTLFSNILSFIFTLLC